jgi:hypothetical protein
MRRETGKPPWQILGTIFALKFDGRKDKTMKKSLWLLLLGLVLIAGCVVYVPYKGEEGSPPPRERERTYESDYRDYPAEMDVSYFYDYLSPYGIWVSYPTYGYVWVPRHMGLGWRPYTNGRWVWTDDGWTWVSYYEWGWVPFHYGRWGWDRRIGWFWVPGTIWGPAWVTWRWSNLYIGWAPLPPDVEFVMGVGINRLPYDLPGNYWIFIEGRYFQYDYLDRYVLPFERNTTIINYTVNKANLSVRNRRVIDDGVDIDQVRRVTRTEVSRYALEDARRPQETRISGNAVRVYRPTVKKDEAARPKSFWQKGEAEEKLPEIRTGDLEKRVSPAETELRLKQEQEKEMRLLQQSQEKENAELRRKIEDQKKLASDEAEKQKIDKEYAVKAKELQKQHEEEKSKIAERHQEEKQVVKKKLKKKEEN